MPGPRILTGVRFFYAGNPNYSYNSAPSILIPELWIKKTRPYILCQVWVESSNYDKLLKSLRSNRQLISPQVLTGLSVLIIIVANIASCYWSGSFLESNFIADVVLLPLIAVYRVATLEHETTIGKTRARHTSGKNGDKIEQLVVNFFGNFILSRVNKSFKVKVLGTYGRCSSLLGTLQLV